MLIVFPEKSMEMSSIHSVTAAPTTSPLDRDASRSGDMDRGLLFAAALFLAVLIVELIIVGIAASSGTDISSFYISTT